MALLYVFAWVLAFFITIAEKKIEQNNYTE